MLVGTIDKISANKGFGFINPQDEGPHVFFHRSAFRGRFDVLKVGQELLYVLDQKADRPRAKKIEPLPRGVAGQQQLQISFGYITKLHRDADQGFISPVKIGKEVLFDRTIIPGRNQRWIRVGQYVAYAVNPDTVDSDQPVASFVMEAEKEIEEPSLSVPRHPRARRRKPTWRQKSNDNEGC